METIGWPELLVIGIVFVVLFGSRKLPDIGKGIGQGIRDFKAALKGEAEKEPETAAHKEIDKV